MKKISKSQGTCTNGINQYLVSDASNNCRPNILLLNMLLTVQKFLFLVFKFPPIAF